VSAIGSCEFRGLRLLPILSATGSLLTGATCASIRLVYSVADSYSLSDIHHHMKRLLSTTLSSSHYLHHTKPDKSGHTHTKHLRLQITDHLQTQLTNTPHFPRIFYISSDVMIDTALPTFTHYKKSFMSYNLVILIRDGTTRLQPYSHCWSCGC